MTTRREAAPVRVAIVSDEPVVREGVIRTLESACPLAVLESTQAHNGLPAKLHDLEPDIIVADLDVSDPQEADCLMGLKDMCPDVPIIVLAGEDRRESVFEAIALGASGYVLKTADKEILCSAVEAALSGSAFGGLEFTPKMMQDFVAHVRERKDEPRSGGLTKRERELLQLMTQGYTNSEISAELFLSVHTVRTYRQRMMQKLGIHSTTDLVIYAITEGLVDVRGTKGNPRPGRSENLRPHRASGE